MRPEEPGGIRCAGESDSWLSTMMRNYLSAVRARILSTKAQGFRVKGSHIRWVYPESRLIPIDNLPPPLPLPSISLTIPLRPFPLPGNPLLARQPIARFPRITHGRTYILDAMRDAFSFPIRMLERRERGWPEEGTLTGGGWKGADPTEVGFQVCGDRRCAAGSARVAGG